MKKNSSKSQFEIKFCDVITAHLCVSNSVAVAFRLRRFSSNQNNARIRSDKTEVIHVTQYS